MLFSKYSLILTGFDVRDGKFIYSTCSLGCLIPIEAFHDLCYCVKLVKNIFFLSSPGQIKKKTTMLLYFQARIKQIKPKRYVSKSLFNGERPVPESFPNQKWTVPQSFPRRKEAILWGRKHPFSASVLSQRGECLSQFQGGMSGAFPSLGVLLSQQLFGDAIPIKLHYGVPLSINFSALQCPQQSLI